jgi:hypothetical protein
MNQSQLLMIKGTIMCLSSKILWQLALILQALQDLGNLLVTFIYSDLLLK